MWTLSLDATQKELIARLEASRESLAYDRGLRPGAVARTLRP